MRNRNTFNDLKTNLTENDIDELVDLLTSRCQLKTKNRVRSILTYGPSSVPTYGILERLVKEDYGWSYCAGQSYPDEIRTIREIITKG